MTLLALITALALEQWQPAGRRNWVVTLFLRYADFLKRHFDGGERQHGTVAWILAVAPGLAGAGAVYYALHWLHPTLGWAWNVAVLYFTMGFRQFSHAFTAIGEALKMGDIQEARNLLAQWRGEGAAEYSGNEAARVAIEQGLIDSHRYVFGIVFWFVLLPGPFGAVLYRSAALLEEVWGRGSADGFGAFARRAFQAIDWLPVRLTAVSFAVVGDFEDAIYCWRFQARSWIEPAHGIILASGAGALGVRLGEPLHQGGTLLYRPELGLGDEADAEMMQSAVGLIWRTTLLWLLLLLLIGIARWVGA